LKTSTAPPHIRVKVPAAAAGPPPLTGASRKAMPRSSQRSANATQWSGNIVEWTTMRLPGRIAGSNCPTISPTPASSTTQMPT
jgi:hypothetical protein